MLAAYNEVNNPDLSDSVGWTPTLFIEIEPTFKVPSAIESRSGPSTGESFVRASLRGRPPCASELNRKGAHGGTPLQIDGEAHIIFAKSTFALFFVSECVTLATSYETHTNKKTRSS